MSRKKGKIKLKIWEMALIIALVATVVIGLIVENQASALSDKLIRLHVVANSDSDEDQALKLKVRDRVIDEMSVFMEGVEDKAGAEAEIYRNLNLIVAAAQDEIQVQGYDYTVSAAIMRENFPTRDYETFSLPAGEYTSLRVIIGEGAGKNWWCVVFPPICTSAAMLKSDSAVLKLTEDEIALITSPDSGYVLKFKVFELWGRLKGLFS